MQAMLRLILLFFILSGKLWSATLIIPWYSQDKDKKTVINIELFLSSTCPHCHKADVFFRSI